MSSPNPKPHSISRSPTHLAPPTISQVKTELAACKGLLDQATQKLEQLEKQSVSETIFCTSATKIKIFRTPKEALEQGEKGENIYSFEMDFTNKRYVLDQYQVSYDHSAFRKKHNLNSRDTSPVRRQPK